MKINNIAYSWAMIELSAPAITGDSPIILNGAQAVSWKRSIHVETNYGVGGQPRNRGIGNTVCEASITLDYNAQVQLRNLCGGLPNLGEFDLVLSFRNDYNTDDYGIETVTIKQCFFNEDAMESSQDDTQITHEYALNPMAIILSSDNAA